MQQLTKRLSAVGYPDAATVDAADLGWFAKVAAWLDEHLLQVWSDAERTVLLQGRAEDALSYLAAIDFPAAASASLDDAETLASAFDWLTSRAVDAAFELQAAPTPQDNAEAADRASAALADPAVARELRILAKELGVEVATTTSPEDVLAAVTGVAERRLASLREGTVAVDPAKLDEMPLGFDIDDAAVARAAKLLRLLYIEDLRCLQNNVNALLSAVQRVTADPKMKASLGRVGK